MCRWASFVLTKDREFWLPDSDSHQEIISCFRLHADGARGPNNLNVEIYPGPEATALDDWGHWVFRIDQDITPDWAPQNDAGAMEAIEARTRAALIRRFKEGFKVVQVWRVPAGATQDLIRRFKEGFKVVDARGCTALASLNAPEAEYVDASGCTKLNKTRRKQ